MLVLNREVRDRYRTNHCSIVHALSVKLQFACRERSFDELHLQCRINGAGWRPVRRIELN